MHRTVRHFAQCDERLKLAKVIIFNAVRPGIERPALFCSPPARIYVQPAVFLLPAGLPCCVARRYVFMCSPLARPVVQPAGTYLCAARWPAVLCSPPARLVVQLAGT